MNWDRSQGGQYSEDREVGLTQRGIHAPAKAAGYMSDCVIEEATQGPLMKEKCGLEWASLST